jgi:hypothetical protein
MTCINCGKNLPNDAVYCMKCGAKQNNDGNNNRPETPSIIGSWGCMYLRQIVDYNEEIMLEKTSNFISFRHDFTMVCNDLPGNKKVYKQIGDKILFSCSGWEKRGGTFKESWEGRLITNNIIIYYREGMIRFLTRE